MEHGGCSASQYYDQFAKWKHLSDLCLVDSEFGVPANIDILLGVNMCSRVVRQSLWQGPSGSPMAMKACFGWVLSGTVRHNSNQHRGEKLPKLNDMQPMTVCQLRSSERSLQSMRKVSIFMKLQGISFPTILLF